MVQNINLSISRRRYYQEHPEAKEKTKQQLDIYRKTNNERLKTDIEYRNLQLSGLLEDAKKRTKIHKEELYDLYWNQKLDMKQVATRLDVHWQSVQKAMKRYGIPSRSKKEAQKLLLKNPEHINILSERTKRYWQNPEYRKLKTEQSTGENNPFYGKHHTEETREKLKTKRKTLNDNGWKPHNTSIPIREWIDDMDTWAKNMHLGLSVSPNKVESQLLTIINNNFEGFVYNGDGKFLVIDGLCPDFIDITNKKIIEVFGEHFHNQEKFKKIFNKDMPIKNSEQYRMSKFKEYGYNTLIIWDYEIQKSTEEQIISKIKTFLSVQPLNSHISFLLDLYNKTTTPDRENIISKLRESTFNSEELSETIQLNPTEIKTVNKLFIEATNNCNLSCIFCPRSKITREKGYMDFDLYKKIIDDATDFGITAISLHGYGEALLHPKIIDMIKYAKEKGINNVSFNTNGMLLTYYISLQLIKSGLDTISFSVDSINPEIYKHMRIGGNLDTVLRHISYLKRLKEKLNSTHPTIYIQNMVTKQTFDEKVAETLNKYTDIISYGFLGSRSNSIEGLKELQLAVSPKNRKKSCELIGTGYAIYWNGDVTVCCGDFNGEYIFDNIKKSSLKKISKNEKLLSFYKIHEDKQFDKVPFCNVCDSDCFPTVVLNIPNNTISKTI